MFSFFLFLLRYSWHTMLYEFQVTIFLLMITGKKNLEALAPMAKPMLTSLTRSFRAGWLPERLSGSLIAISHGLFSLVSDNLPSCLCGFSIHFFFPPVETLDLTPARYIPGNASLLIPDEKLESRTRRVLSNTYQKLIQCVFLDDCIPNGLKYIMWVSVDGPQISLPCLSLGDGRCFSPTTKGKFQVGTK